jgi:hypothetical protein
MNTPTKEFEDKKEPTKPLTREQRRHMDRVEKEAKQVLSQLQERFLKRIMESDDPEGQDVIDFVDQIHAKWKLYCQQKRIMPEAHKLILDYCLDTLKQYSENKKSDKPVEPETIQADEK